MSDDTTQHEALNLASGQQLGAYELIRQVGAGGMGVVFEARHRERNTVVALKTLHKLEPLALRRLKTEFRSVADVLHRNLVLLHELCYADGIWFFTMEYVEGENLASRLRRATDEKNTPGLPTSMDTTTWVIPGESLAPNEPTITVGSPRMMLASPSPKSPLPPPGEGVPAPLMESRELRRIFSELAEGIITLHESRRLHCDIKPANIMVARDGRTVLLDFGLVNDRSVPRTEELLMGTPSYMAPEQAAGNLASEATDWYALGIILYEALSGQRPFPPFRSLQEVQRREAAPLPPSPDIPEDLRQLCMALLHRSPSHRPSGHQVLQVLRGETSPASSGSTPRLQMGLGRVFIGRQQHLNSLHDAYRTVRAGRPVTLHVYGRSGLGKTSLVQQFLEELQRQEQVLVLHGRCYERESLPYKGVDSLVDSLTQYLSSLPPGELQSLLPRDLGDIARIFPVLRQVLPPVRSVPPAEEEPRDKQETRRRAFQALKVLLCNLAERIPLILHLDDIQWGAPDSFTLLHGLISPPGAPRLLLLCSFRNDEAEATTFLAEHRRLRSLLGDSIDIREVEVEPLSPDHSRELAAALLMRPETDAQVQEVVRESHGSPLFLEELIRYSISQGAGTDGASPRAPRAATLEKVVLSRVAGLPEAARHLLELVAVAGRSLPQGIAIRAAALQGDSHKLWSLLRTQCLVRTHGIRDESPVECYHDRIREHLHNSLSPEVLRAHHLRLARSYEAAGLEAPEVLAQHFLGAGLREQAGHHLAIAADKAAEALAFERAAELYRQASECVRGDTSLLVKRADALVNAGRCAQAAPLYLQAAQEATGAEAFSLQMRAAEQWLVSGRFDEGLAILRPLLELVDVAYPDTPEEALRCLIENTLHLQARGTGFQERPEAACAPELLRRIDVAWTAGKGLGSLDVLRGAYFNLVATRLALDAGEPRRICLGLTWTGVLMASQATPESIAWGRQLIQEAERIAQRLESRHLIGYTQALKGMKHMVLSEMPQALASFAEGLRLLNQCPGVSWELSQVWSCTSAVLWQHGSMRELAGKGMTWWRHAQESGDHCGMVWLQLYMSSAQLAAGDAAAASQLVAEIQPMLSTQRFTPQHLLYVVKACDSDLYRGEPEAAWERITQAWRTAELSHAMGWPIFRVLGVHARGAAAVALAQRRPSERESLLASAEKDAADLAQVGQQCTPGAPLLGHYLLGVAALLRASAAGARGLRAQALAELDDAMTRFGTSGERLFAACARRRKGELLAGDEGQALIEASEAEMQAQGIREPARWTEIYAPSFLSSRLQGRT
jgi:serine/threonine protein kinase/tetratricopeptide (TPR) repeat protein